MIVGFEMFYQVFRVSSFFVIKERERGRADSSFAVGVLVICYL